MPHTTGTTHVVGLGKSGLSTVRALQAQGATIAVSDSRVQPPGLDALRTFAPEIPCHCGPFDAQLFQQAARLIVSPGIAISTPAIAQAAAAGIPMMGDIELLAQYTSAPIIGITGSNGKSTVTTLLGEMAERCGIRAAVGGNLGTPALDLWLEHEWKTGTAPDVYILELSSFQLETTHSLNARVATVLNISPDHMDRYDRLEEYIAAKARIFHGNGTMVVNADDPVVMAMVAPHRTVIPFTSYAPDAPHAFWLLRDGKEIWLMHGQTRWIGASTLQISGEHNLMNALAALAMGTALGWPREGLCEALRHFKGLAHRMVLVKEQAGVRWYNDSKGTNVGATIAAVRGAPGQVVLIAGGDGKQQDFRPLAPVLREKGRAVVLIGRDGPLIAAAVNDAVSMDWATDMDDAVKRAALLAKTGDSVLLSPACASFDMYSGYEERGHVFAEAVQRWVQ